MDKLITNKKYSIAQIYPKLQMAILPTLDNTSMANWSKDFPMQNVVAQLLFGIFKDLQINCLRNLTRVPI